MPQVLLGQVNLQFQEKGTQGVLVTYFFFQVDMFCLLLFSYQGIIIRRAVEEGEKQQPWKGNFLLLS